MHLLRIYSLILITFLALELRAQAPNYYELMKQGNELYKEKKYPDAQRRFEQALRAAKDKNAQADAFFNLGNNFAAQNNWSATVDQYKQALKLNPEHKDAKYNLSYALKKMKEQQQQQNQDKDKNKDKKDNKQDEQNKEDNNQDKKDDNKDKQQQTDNKEQDQKNKDNDKPDNQSDKGQNQNEAQRKEENNANAAQHSRQENKLTEQRAAEMLKAIQQAEQKVQERNMQRRGTPPAILDKDW